MKSPLVIRVCALFALLFLSFSCERTPQETGEKPEISVLESGKLELSAKKDFPRTIYVDIRDATGHVPLTPEVLPAMLKEDNFEIVDNPSKAAYILHISLLEEGRTNPAALAEQVREGYDSEAKFSGEGVSAWLCDALLVQRHVPEASRESQTRLKNISARNAIASSQMRFAIYATDQLKGRKEYAQTFVYPLASAIRQALGHKPKTEKNDQPRKESDKKDSSGK